MRGSADRKPSEREIGARVRIHPAHQAEIEALFDEAMIIPIYKEMRTDGNVSYWFGKNQISKLAEACVLERIPPHYWAHHVVIGQPPIIE
ncbi:hypothetical protein [Sphingopyxis sp. R3-92]|uniref:hypothetical protein n=1 Tax=Sphingopyxis sp. R3-92 TaxID=3158553 RepID=UPI003EE57509